MAWKAQGARFILFPAGNAEVLDANDVWNKVLPARRPSTVNRSDAPGNPHSSAAGNVKTEQITITCQLGRVDLYVTGINPNWADPATICEPTTLIDVVVHYAKKCIPVFAASRYALVLDVMKHADSAVDACKKVHDELSFIVVSEETRDVNFQINNLKPFVGLADQKMNRLCRWGSAALQTLNFNSSGTLLSQRTSAHIVTLQLDVSTELLDAQPAAIDSGEALVMVDQIKSEVVALLANGYGALA